MFFLFFKQKTAYEVRISDWSSDVCSSDLRWPEKVRLMQRKWIGRSEGATLRFRIEGLGESQDDRLTVFTTRPDTLFGASFCALAANHPLAVALAANDPSAAAFVAECNRLGTSEEAKIGRAHV